ncbi:MAG TPA: TIGR04086 family membrane protein [Candidatus Limnocylindria bacterium]|nr:TIGR04086 family membrane protein [Candidatus Limnocylindria bacterium]
MTEVVTPRGTSWMSVLGGWIASLGMMALLAPLVMSATATRGGTIDDISLAVPALLALVIAYLVGGYVAGRMAGYRTSWHGMMVAFWSLFVVLAVLLVGYAAQQGTFGDVRLFPPDVAYPWAFGPQTAGDALTFGAIVGFLATIFAAWLGGLLAPARSVASRVVSEPVAAAPVEHRVTETRVERPVEPAPQRRPYRLLPAIGRKGGERVHESERTERTEHVDRVDRDTLS